MSIEKKLRFLRIASRQNSRFIVNNIIQANISRQATKPLPLGICMFCGSQKQITKEHVIPRWTYAGCTKKDFTTNINGLSQTYNKTVISACSTCNNDLLGELELYINNLFSATNLNTDFFNNNERSNIIRWLEIIDYKFQVLNSKRHFLASKDNGFIPYLADFPLAILRPNINYSPAKAVSEIRRSFKRLTKKNKILNLNSLIVFKSSNKGFHFFHTMDDFIFIELPQYKLALFYFYKKVFATEKDAKDEADKIISKVY